MKSTKICFVASLLVLDIINRQYNECVQTRDWSFFTKTSSQLNSFFYEIFKAPTVSSHRSTVSHPYISLEFNAILTEFAIALENVKSLNNIAKTMCHTYAINFAKNIVMHAKPRLKALLNLKYLQIAGIRPNKKNKKIIDKTVNFMFNDKSKCARQDEIDDILAYIPNMVGINIDVADTHVRDSKILSEASRVRCLQTIVKHYSFTEKLYFATTAAATTDLKSRAKTQDIPGAA